MAKIGYMRVSKNDQNTDLQRKALICANCDQIFEDKISGKTDQRPGLKRALSHIVIHIFLTHCLINELHVYLRVAF